MSHPAPRRSHTILVLGTVWLAAAAVAWQADARLLRRWVGTHQNRPLTFEFFGDTMLVVNDATALDYRARGGTLEARGDTAFTVSYWFAMDRLLLRTAEGNIITMAPQDVLARPLDGRWRGSTLGSGVTVELRMLRGGIASWREVPGGAWIAGEWDRDSRVITFTWLPDSVVWTGRYDPGGNALLFEETDLQGGTVILHRAYRW
ncbi:MAG: hypothetical protein PVF27_00920 [Gemmatimonadales bacterium]|jgi:hypothetical protein